MAEAVVSTIMEQLSYAVSEGTLPRIAGVEREIEKLKRNFGYILDVLADAEERQVNDRAVRVWVDKIKDLCYDVEDMLDEWNTARLKFEMEGVDESDPLLRQKKKKVCSFFLPASCFGTKHIFLRHDIALKIEAFNEVLDEIVQLRDEFNFTRREVRSLEIPPRDPTVSLVDEDEVIGREEEKEIIMSKLLSESSENQIGPHIISILGIGGIGKTTLARLVYHDYWVANHFDQRIWVCVSDNFDLFMIAKSILKSLQGTVPNFEELESLLRYITKCIVGNKFFLVLDNVWTEDYSKWEPLLQCLMNGLHGSRILITTRNQRVARMLDSTDIIEVHPLSLGETWSLFERLAFFNRSNKEYEELEDIGRELVYKCKGLPLAVKAIGGILRFKNTRREWERILESEMWDVELELGVLAPLLLSYNDLPVYAKRCFSYCAIFPKDFQIEKDKLIKLWMAQGYLRMGERKDMEIVGQMYFDLLVTRSFFQGLKKDDNGNILRCEMHDIVHDCAQYLTRNEVFCMEVSGGLQETNESIGHNKLHHLMLALTNGASFPISMSSAKKVRSLLIQYGVTNCSSISDALPMLFRELTSLRALDLSGQLWCENVEIKIPREIGELKLLRYLNLSLLKINELPEELCELYDLQTLELSWCPNLRKLPQGMGKLIKLRHLVNVETSLSYMPRGIERLTSLQTLSEFVVSGGGDDSQACTLACLKNLNHLRGSLHIKNLGTVTDFSEFAKAELHYNKEVTRLYLNFENEGDEVSMNEDEESRLLTDESVFDALQMPPYLEFLEIRGYKGNTRFLDCIMFLNELKTLNLHSCTNLVRLPPLGKLPCLESLSISSVQSVRVGDELLGIRCDGASSSSSDIAFPKLKSLKFVNMEEWEVWDCWTIMPCLHFLSLVHCPKLTALPDHILQTETLEELTINWCPILEERYNKSGEWHNISSIPNIMINFEYVQRGRP